MKITNELTEKQKKLVFEKPLKDFSDKDWVELYKILDELRKKRKEDDKECHLS